CRAGFAGRGMRVARVTGAQSRVRPRPEMYLGSDFLPRGDLGDEREEAVVQGTVRRDHPGPEGLRLVEEEWTPGEVGRAPAGLFDEQRAGADVPLVLRREREGRVARAGRELRELPGDAPREPHVDAALEGVPLAALVLGAAREHDRIGDVARRADVRRRA